MVKNTYKNITKDEKIQLYLKIIEQLHYKEDIANEKRRNLHKTEYRQERQYQY